MHCRAPIWNYQTNDSRRALPHQRSQQGQSRNRPQRTRLQHPANNQSGRRLGSQGQSRLSPTKKKGPGSPEPLVSTQPAGGRGFKVEELQEIKVASRCPRSALSSIRKVLASSVWLTQPILNREVRRAVVPRFKVRIRREVSRFVVVLE